MPAGFADGWTNKAKVVLLQLNFGDLWALKRKRVGNSRLKSSKSLAAIMLGIVSMSSNLYLAQ